MRVVRWRALSGYPLGALRIMITTPVGHLKARGRDRQDDDDREAERDMPTTRRRWDAVPRDAGVTAQELAGELAVTQRRVQAIIDAGGNRPSANRASVAMPTASSCNARM